MVLEKAHVLGEGVPLVFDFEDLLGGFEVPVLKLMRIDRLVAVD